jgi:Na+/H+-dicarboxylate symporter
MAGAAVSDWKFLGMGMGTQVALGLVLGVTAGMVLGTDAAMLAVLGTIFIKLVKMVVAPLIFFALIAGITSLTQEKHFKTIAVKGTAAYLFTAAMAVVMGLIIANLFEPGVGVAPPAADADMSAIAAARTPPGIGDFLMHLIPSNIINALAGDFYLQIVVFAVFTGIVMNNIRGHTAKVKELNAELAHITFKMIEWIVRLAPLAVFGYMAAMVGNTGFEAIVGLLRLVALVIGACVFQYLFFGFLILVFARISPLPFYRKLVPTQIMAFSTSSSKATLSTAMRELQDKMGVSMSSSNFMMPLGACINMDGTAIYLGIAAVFFSQMYGIPLDMGDYATLVLTCTLGSIGAAGIPSGSIIFMGMVLGSVGLPMEGIALLLGVDRILDMFRTTVNITGDAAITLIIDKTEGELDMTMYNDASLK